MYQWYRNDGDTTGEIIGATGISYTVTTGDQAMTISFEVTPVGQSTAQGDAEKSAGVVINSFPVASEVTITGTANTGEILTGDYTYSDIDAADWKSVGSANFSSGDTSFATIALDSDNTPYVAYEDEDNSNAVTVMKFNGRNWELVGIPGFSVGQSSYISLSVYSGTPYVAYQDCSVACKATVMKYTGTGDTGREPVGTKEFSDTDVYYTSLSIYDGTPYIAYADTQ